MTLGTPISTTNLMVSLLINQLLAGGVPSSLGIQSGNASKRTALEYPEQQISGVEGSNHQGFC